MTLAGTERYRDGWETRFHAKAMLDPYHITVRVVQALVGSGNHKIQGQKRLYVHSPGGNQWLSGEGQRNVILVPFIWLPGCSSEDEIAWSQFYNVTVLLQAFVKHKGVCSQHCRLRTCFHWDAYLQFAVALKPDRFPVFHLAVLALDGQVCCSSFTARLPLCWRAAGHSLKILECKG